MNNGQSSNPVPVATEYGAARDFQIHTRGATSKLTHKSEAHKSVSKADSPPVVNIVPENVQTIPGLRIFGTEAMNSSESNISNAVPTLEN